MLQKHNARSTTYMHVTVTIPVHVPVSQIFLCKNVLSSLKFKTISNGSIKTVSIQMEGRGSNSLWYMWVLENSRREKTSEEISHYHIRQCSMVCPTCGSNYCYRRLWEQFYDSDHRVQSFPSLPEINTAKFPQQINTVVVVLQQYFI